MTRNEFIEKYGTAEVTFSNYYKYTFTYSGTLPDGAAISVDYGGNADEIYRHEVAPNVPETVRALCPCAGAGRVTKDGQEIDSFYDY